MLKDVAIDPSGAHKENTTPRANRSEKTKKIIYVDRHVIVNSTVDSGMKLRQPFNPGSDITKIGRHTKGC